MSQGPLSFDPNNPFGMRPKLPTSPFAPDTCRPGIQTGDLFRTPPIMAPQTGAQGGFIDPRNPLGFPTRNPYGNISFDGNVNVNQGPVPGSTLDAYWKRMVELMPTQRQQALGDLGSIMGSFAGDERTNRVIRGNAQQGLDGLMLDREANQNRVGLDAQSEFDKLKLLAANDKRSSTSDAMQKIQMGGWLQSGGNASAPGGAHRAVSDQEKTAAASLIDQTHAQLNRPEYEPTKFTPDKSYQPMDPNEYAKPGVMERIGQYGGLASGALGMLDKFGGANGGAGSFLSKFLGGGGGATTGIAGKALPALGAIQGGVGLMRNQGLGRNVMNGVTTGASIGSMVPVIGTAVGAGVGGVIGGLRSLFGRNKKPQGLPASSGPGQYRVN